MKSAAQDYLKYIFGFAMFYRHPIPNFKSFGNLLETWQWFIYNICYYLFALPPVPHEVLFTAWSSL